MVAVDIESGPVGPALPCPDCGLEQRVPDMPAHMIATCLRCSATLERRAGTNLDAALALAATGLLLLIPANVLPILSINLGGAERQDWIATGVGALWDQGFRVLAADVAALAVIAPPLWLGGLVVVLGAVRFGIRRPWLGILLRWLDRLRPWAMADVFLVGSMIAYTRLGDIALVRVEPAGWAFILAALVSLAVDPATDYRRVWEALGSDRPGAPAPDDFACLGCERRSAAAEIGTRCPRCGAVLRARKPQSIVRATALVTAAYLLYVPANLLPVMTVVRFGRAEPNTILSGVQELITLGMWPLALIVFMASIAVPLAKLTGLTWFLIALRRRAAGQLALRTRLYRIIDKIGRWSNIDVFMISILAALVRFDALTNVRAEPGAFAFAAVVLLTMLASSGFDPRLMWDVAEPQS